VLVAAAGLGGCAERCVIGGRDPEEAVLAEMAKILASLPKDSRALALAEAATGYVVDDPTRPSNAGCAALLERAGADLDWARRIREERRGRHGFTVA